MDFGFRPIVQWPQPFTKVRRNSPFQAGYNQTLDLLRSELAALRAKSVVIQTAMTPEMIRNDGLPRASARPSHPGVIVSFQTAAGALSFPCDSYVDWESNLRAIALALEALRKVDRYGVTRNSEQYKGWQALPSPPQDDTTTPEGAASWLAGVLFANDTNRTNARRVILASPSLYKDAYRKAAARLHPDSQETGSEEKFKRLQDVKTVLDRYYEGPTAKC